MFVDQEHKVLFFHTPKTAGRSLFKTFGFYEGNDIRLSHFLPEDAIACIFQQTWSNYWKFAFARNPWDRYVSLYEFHRQSEYVAKYNSYSHKHAKAHDFKTWMFLNKNKFIFSSWFGIPQSSWHRGMDAVYKFEELDYAVREIGDHLPIVEPIQHTNSTIHSSYQSYYDRDLIDAVREIDNDTITRFGYKFGE